MEQFTGIENQFFIQYSSICIVLNVLRNSLVFYFYQHVLCRTVNLWRLKNMYVLNRSADLLSGQDEESFYDFYVNWLEMWTCLPFNMSSKSVYNTLILNSNETSIKRQFRKTSVLSITVKKSKIKWIRTNTVRTNDIKFGMKITNRKNFTEDLDGHNLSNVEIMFNRLS